MYMSLYIIQYKETISVLTQYILICLKNTHVLINLLIITIINIWNILYSIAYWRTFPYLPSTRELCERIMWLFSGTQAKYGQSFFYWCVSWRECCRMDSYRILFKCSISKITTFLNVFLMPTLVLPPLSLSLLMYLYFPFSLKTGERWCSRLSCWLWFSDSSWYMESFCWTSC